MANLLLNSDRPQPTSPLAHAAWADVSNLFQRELGELTAQPFDAAPSPKQPPTFGMAARIALVASATDTETRVTIRADHGSLVKLAETMLGETQPEKAMLEDLLREVSNTVAGVMKRIAPPDTALTTGLPETIATVETFAAFSSAPQRFALRMVGQPIELAFAVESVRRGKHMVPASDLKEGMVLVRDVRNDAGLLLAPSGTRLTSSAAERVSRVLGDQQLVEISVAA